MGIAAPPFKPARLGGEAYGMASRLSGKPFPIADPRARLLTQSAESGSSHRSRGAHLDPGLGALAV